MKDGEDDGVSESNINRPSARRRLHGFSPQASSTGEMLLKPAKWKISIEYLNIARTLQEGSAQVPRCSALYLNLSCAAGRTAPSSAGAYPLLRCYKYAVSGGGECPVLNKAGS